MSTDLAYLSATEALARFRDRSLSPVELTEALIARAAEVEPTVNALCITYFDEALAQAREAEQRYLGQGAEPRPLEGICVGIKDEMPIAGQRCSMGSLRYKDDVAEYTDPVGQRLIDAGAILHARTTAPEFSCAGFTHSRLWGVTRNPWNPEFGVGGSSGGTGASLASGTSTLATGSDIGGSIRIPASWNGVVGFKPPYGRVPQMPPFNLDHYCHTGPLARTVSDCALFENIIAGPHPHDPVAIRPKLELPLDVRRRHPGHEDRAVRDARRLAGRRRRGGQHPRGRGGAGRRRRDRRGDRDGPQLGPRQHLAADADPLRRHLRRVDRDRARAPRADDAVRHRHGRAVAEGDRRDLVLRGAGRRGAAALRARRHPRAVRAADLPDDRVARAGGRRRLRRPRPRGRRRDAELVHGRLHDAAVQHLQPQPGAGGAQRLRRQRRADRRAAGRAAVRRPDRLPRRRRAWSG